MHIVISDTQTYVAIDKCYGHVTWTMSMRLKPKESVGGASGDWKREQIGEGWPRVSIAVASSRLAAC